MSKFTNQLNIYAVFNPKSVASQAQTVIPDAIQTANQKIMDDYIEQRKTENNRRAKRSGRNFESSH
ncbi:MAG: hypothetical protein WAL23_08125 [Nitrososphaeraceae archaeon]